jgi:hypothetical protein
MPAAPMSVAYDADRWIHVPLDYLDTPWSDAGEWAGWLADEATRGRPDADALRAAVAEEAFATAVFPAEHVSLRFWHYPSDGAPTGFVDIYVQAREDDGASAEELLPEPGFTVVPPVVEPVAAPAMPTAVRRLSIEATLPSPDSEPLLVPKGEWIGAGAGWVVYAVSTDFDVTPLESRLADIDALFAAIDPAKVGAP